MYYISSFLLTPRENDPAHSLLLIPNGSRVFPLSIRYASLAFRTLHCSLLDLMSSTEWNKCDVVSRVIISKKVFWDCGGFRDIRWVVNWSVVFQLKLSLSRRLVSAILCLEPKHFHCIRSIRNCKTIGHHFGFIQWRTSIYNHK